MFQLMPSGGPSPPKAEKGLKGKIMSFYYDPFKWSVVKSVIFFAVGVKTANDFVGFDVLSSSP